jgi:hypothetical protein
LQQWSLLFTLVHDWDEYHAAQRGMALGIDPLLKVVHAILFIRSDE